MSKVLHYKTNFLNETETFINRLVKNHKKFRPAALCYRSRSFTENIDLFEAPKRGLKGLLNIASFHLNLTLPYYREVIEREKPDIIHAHFGFDAVKLMKLASSAGIPLVVSFYGSDVSRLPSEFDWKRRYKRLARYGAHFIAATSFMKEQLIELGFPENRISIVRFGVMPHSNKVFCLNLSRMMMVGRMVEKKGFEYAIQAVVALHNRGIPVELDLYGDGPLMKKLVSLVNDSGARKFIHFHGHQPVETILEAHQNHSLLLAPSVTAKNGDMEGLPNTILEAMTMKTIVVAARHAAIPEVIEHQKTGFLVDERDVLSLTDTLEEIITGKFDLEFILNNARNVIEREYRADQMVEDVENIYNDLLPVGLKKADTSLPLKQHFIEKELTVS